MPGARRRPLTLLLSGLLLAGAAPGVVHVATAGGTATPRTGASAAPASSGPPAPATAPVPARPAAEFLDSIGVVVHTDRPTGPYLDGELVARRLRELGIRHVRTHLDVPTPDTQTAVLDELADAGIGLDVTAMPPTGDPQRDRRIADGLMTALGTYRGPLDSVEGVNEYDNNGVEDWVPRLRAMSAQLYAAVREADDPRVARLPVLAPSLVGFRLSTNAPALGDMSGVSTAGALHSYPSGLAPESSPLLSWVDLVKGNVSGVDRPVVVTETGYHGALRAHWGVPDQVAATYVPRLLLMDFAAGLPRTYLYELADEGVVVDGVARPEPRLEVREAHLGLLGFDLSPKPVASSIATLTTLLRDDPLAPPALPGARTSLPYTLEGAPSDLRQVLLRKPDGTFWLALWRTAPVWDPQRSAETPVTGVPVRVGLAGGTGVLSSYDLRSGTRPVSSTVGGSISVPVSGDVSLVQVRLAQAPPTAVRAAPADGSATVSWTPPVDGPTPVTGYRVTPSSGGTAVVVGPSASQAVVTGLANGVSRTFTVTALSQSGDSVPSGPSPAVVPAAVPGSPLDVQVRPGDARAEVSWAPPADDGGAPVTSYTVTADPGGASTTVPGTSAVLYGLADGVDHRITVRAANTTGPGPASPGAVVRPQHRPGTASGVTATPGDGSATVRWTPDPGAAPGSTTAVVVSPGGRTVPAGSSPLVVDGLVDGEPYSFVVRVTPPAPAGGSDAADGPADSAPSTPVVPAGLPTAPPAPQAVVDGAGVRLSWPASDGRGSPVTGYRLTVAPGGRQLEVPGTDAAVDGLDLGTAYRFTVAARNAVGTSPESPPSAEVVPATAPGAPGDVTAGRGDRSATVTWSPADAHGAPVTAYQVTASPGGATATVTGSPAVVEGLVDGKAYTFRVHAVNAQGAGPDSSPTAPVVPLGPPPAPGPVTAVVGSTNALVRWSPAGSSGGPVLRYSVTALPGGSTVTVDGSATSALVPDLVDGTSYVFAVRAATGAGSGPERRSRAYVPSRAPVVLDDRGPATVLGGWSSVADPSSAGGSYRVSRTAGDTVVVRFTGDSVGWLSRSGPGAGTVSAQVDGGPRRTVRLATPRARPTTRTLSGYGPGAHELTLTVTSSGAPVAVEGFRTSAGTVDDAAVPLGWSGWSGGAARGAYGGGRSTAARAATATVTATGTGLEWLTAVGPSGGRASVVLDGVAQPAVDLYAPSAAPRTLSWLGLAPGPHTLTLTVSGTARPVATGSEVVLDGVGVRR